MFNVFSFEKELNKASSKDAIRREMYKTNSFRDRKFVK